MKPLFIRADASALIGTGHVMRMLSLAQAWLREEGGLVVFLCAQLPDALAGRLRAEGCTVVMLRQASTQADDAHATLSAMANYIQVSGFQFQVSDGWLLADGYHFGPDFQQAIKAGGVRLLVMDDNGENGAYECDLVLNQNIHADKKFYARRAPQTRLLLGTRYALLRSEFLSVKRTREISSVARRVLLTLGGADPGNMTGQALASLAALGRIEGELCVVLGGGNPRGTEIEQAAHLLPWSRVRVLRNVTNMPELMQEADLAVTAGGSTCWEMCLLGLPMLVISIAENQRGLVQGLGAAGAAVVAGHAGEFDPSCLGRQIAGLCADAAQRQALSAVAQRAVDGLGVQRVLAALRGEELFLRPATMGDAELLWVWANDPVTRAVSFQPASIPWPVHLGWLQRKLADKRVTLFMAETEDGPAGMMRFEVEAEHSAVVSVALAPEARGRGLGTKLIAAGTQRFAAATETRIIHAYIKPDNRSSVAAFERAGYGIAGDVVMAGAPAVQRVWRKV
jgi:UDP-2,4-diacetamido-2,4,6-trideoxy-beta-L-altropyranose hydrolase